MESRFWNLDTESGVWIESLEQTVEKPRVQSGKTVIMEFPRAQPEGTSEGQFFQAARGFSTVSQTLLTL